MPDKYVKMKIYIQLFLSFALTSIIGCNNKNCKGAAQIEDVVLSFQLVDSSGTSLIGEYRKYDPEYIKFLNSDGVPSNIFYFGGDGTVYFYLVDEYVYDSIVNEYHMILPPVASFPFEDVDTIKVATIIQRTTDCEFPILKQVRISYNDSLYFSDAHLPYASFDFYKL
ncbi:MAG: hypothetical protein IT270_10700 [Saprospiraceae bacterium]|nr:hypothetical protein [Saprospiraceae bacterium]